MPTKQETFDAVVKHARTQRRKSEDHSSCLYRTEDGLKCFAGALVPDDRYRPGYEGPLFEYPNGSTEPGELTAIAEIIVEGGHDINFVYDLQRVHDSKEVSEWESEFSRIALEQSLVYAPPESPTKAK